MGMIDKATSAVTIKGQIAEAITSKGVDMSGAVFSDYPSKILQISGGGTQTNVITNQITMTEVPTSGIIAGEILFSMHGTATLSDVSNFVVCEFSGDVNATANLYSVVVNGKLNFQGQLTVETHATGNAELYSGKHYGIGVGCELLNHATVIDVSGQTVRNYFIMHCISGCNVTSNGNDGEIYDAIGGSVNNVNGIVKYTSGTQIVNSGGYVTHVTDGSYAGFGGYAEFLNCQAVMSGGSASFVNGNLTMSGGSASFVNGNLTMSGGAVVSNAVAGNVSVGSGCVVENLLNVTSLYVSAGGVATNIAMADGGSATVEYGGTVTYLVPIVSANALPSEVRSGRTFYSNGTFSAQQGTIEDCVVTNSAGHLQVTSGYLGASISLYYPVTSEATAVASDVRTGKTFYAGDGFIKTGAMGTATVTSGATVTTLTSGYFGGGVVATYIDPSNANAQQSCVRSGYTFYAGNNVRKSGSMPNSTVTETSAQAVITSGYLPNAVTVSKGGGMPVIPSSGWTQKSINSQYTAPSAGWLKVTMYCGWDSYSFFAPRLVVGGETVVEPTADMEMGDADSDTLKFTMYYPVQAGQTYEVQATMYFGQNKLYYHSI